MCGIVGFTNKNNSFKEANILIKNMANKIVHRGENDEGFYSFNNVFLAHKRLSIRDLNNGHQPMSFFNNYGQKFTIIYNGEIYNTDYLKDYLEKNNIKLNTTSDTEIIIKLYILEKEECLKMIKGIYAFCIYDEENDELFLARDEFGIKPLFYSIVNNDIIFASEIKGIFEAKEVKHILDKEGLEELLGMSPVLPIGKCIFKDIREVMPGHFIKFKNGILNDTRYFKLKSYKHTDNLEDTIKKVRCLLTDSVKSQLISDVEVGTLLSGGLDSSLITAVSANYLKEKGELEKLKTFSVDYEDSIKNFQKTDFTPDRDNKYIDIMRKDYNLNHKYIVLDNESLYKSLYDAMIARDLPSMADIDSSLFLFFKNVKKDVTVALSGEYSDEIFCGYPWFYREDTINANTFPWSIS